MPDREHINEDGEFQSDKYPWCEPGFVPLKLTDPAAREVLLRYADLREPIDPAFSSDLRYCIADAGGGLESNAISKIKLFIVIFARVLWACIRHPLSCTEITVCPCWSCASQQRRTSRMIVCPDCGNKRCPRATDHEYACTNSNKSGQHGSRFR